MGLASDTILRSAANPLQPQPSQVVLYIIFPSLSGFPPGPFVRGPFKQSFSLSQIMQQRFNKVYNILQTNLTSSDILPNSTP